MDEYSRTPLRAAQGDPAYDFPPQQPSMYQTPQKAPFASRAQNFILGCLGGILLAIMAPVLLLGGCVYSCGRALDGMDTGSLLQSTNILNSEVIREGEGEEKIAVLSISGVIGYYPESAFFDAPRSGNAARLQEELRKIQESGEYSALVLDMNTPGGEVVACDQIRTQLDRLTIPVVTCMRSMAASGGYYIASGSDVIVANPMTLTGSIGVILQSVEYKELLEKIGVKSVVYRSGDFKDILSGAREATPEEKEYLQKMVTQDFHHFCEVVSRGRAKRFPTPEDVAKSPAGDGRPISGDDALTLGLVDALGDFEDALEIAKSLGKCPDASVVRVGSQNTLRALFENYSNLPHKNASLTLPGMPQGALPQGERFYLAAPAR